MKRSTGVIGLFLLSVLLVSPAAFAQSEQRGEIAGVVRDEQGGALPGVTVVLKGEKLFLRSLSTVSNERGLYRFVALIPGIYELELSLPSFNTVRVARVQVSVGKSTPADVTMTPAAVTEEVTVIGAAPLIETKTPQISTNFSNFQIENTPTSRHFIDIVNAAPGAFDHTAYGASGNVSWGGGGVYLARGSMTSAFKLNGVDISNANAGYTTLNPVYETIEEVQVVGIGASAEYGQFVGASVNVITKSGSNTFHGSLTAAYTDSKNFFAKNATGYDDYIYTMYWKHDYDVTGTFSGPLIKEKLFFSIAGGYEDKLPRYQTSTIYQPFTVARAYAKLDYQLDNKNTLSLMYNGSFADQGNQGLYSGAYSPSVAYHSKAPNNSVFASWNSIFSSNTFMYVKFAGYKDEIKWDPLTQDVPQYIDNVRGRVFGGSSMDRNVYSSRWEINTALTHFADELFGMSHELKFGLEYERSQAGEFREYCGGGALSSTAQPSGSTLWTATVGGGQDLLGKISSVRSYVQDNLKVNKHLNLNLGLRFENPRINARNWTGSNDIASFNILSPRLGFTYDVGGDAKTVLRGSFGVYYNKPLTMTYTYAFPGNADRFTYQLLLPNEDFDPTDQNIIDRLALVAQAQNLVTTYKYSLPMPVDPDIKLNNSHTFNVGFSKQLSTEFAVDFDYIYRTDHNRYYIQSSAQHTYAEAQWTDPWLNKTITIWNQVDRNPDTDLLFKNSNFYKKTDHLLIFVFKKLPSRNWSLIASYTWQNSKSNMAGSASNDIFGFPDYNVDTDPAFYDNPLQWGRSWMREHQGKIMTTYFGPWGINATADLRLMSGLPWHAQINSTDIPVALRPYRGVGSYELLLEPRGVRDGPVSAVLNFRLSKSFNIRGSRLEVMADVFNALNATYYYNTEKRPYATYLNGDSKFGKPTSIFPPRSTRLGIKWGF